MRVYNAEKIWKLLIVTKLASGNKTSKYDNFLPIFKFDLIYSEKNNQLILSHIFKRLIFLKAGHCFSDDSAYRNEHFYTQWQLSSWNMLRTDHFLRTWWKRSINFLYDKPSKSLASPVPQYFSGLNIT